MPETSRPTDQPSAPRTTTVPPGEKPAVATAIRRTYTEPSGLRMVEVDYRPVLKQLEEQLGTGAHGSAV